MLPVDPAAIVSLGEGATPLVSAPRLAGELGFGELMLKNETANPTGSFKDRQVAVGISHAREIGAKTVAVVSSGNVAAATSAYAARAGMKAVLFMHGQAGRGKITQATAYGARVISVDAPAPSTVFDLCIEACTRWGWYHLSTAGIYEPYNVEGAKTIAYELYQQYEGNLPDWIVAPVGGGGLLGGVWRGLCDLERMGLVKRMPKLAGVQASGCAPLKRAIDGGESPLESLAEPWPNPDTIAGGIADDILFDAQSVIPAIRQTHGTAIAVADSATEAALAQLARREGLLCELTSAPAIAALSSLPDVDADTRVCCLVTGNGLKDLNYIAGQTPPVPVIEPSLSALEAVVTAAG